MVFEVLLTNYKAMLNQQIDDITDLVYVISKQNTVRQ